MDWVFAYNALEIGVWLALAGGLAANAVRHDGRARRHGLLAGLVFVAFAGSDAVELWTGAWWRPWWLPVWKAACVVCLAGLYALHVRRRNSAAVQSSTASGEPPSPPG